MAPIVTTTTAETTAENDTNGADLRERILTLANPAKALTEVATSQMLRAALDSGEPELCADLIMTIHGRGATVRAREIASQARQRFPDSKRLQQIEKLVAAPKVIPGATLPRIDRRSDYEWLKVHAREYPGEWLVLSGGKLWGHSRSLEEAMDQAAGAGLAERPLLYQVSES
jgi:hypothetical protein